MSCKTAGCKGKVGKIGGSCGACRMRKCRSANPMSTKFKALQRSAEKRGIPFLLTLEQFSVWATESNYLDLVGVRGHHCDRVDASKGYEVGNIRLLHFTTNCSKGARSERGLRKAPNAA